jgi:hypothetical protein
MIYSTVCSAARASADSGSVLADGSDEEVGTELVALIPLSGDDLGVPLASSPLAGLTVDDDPHEVSSEQSSIPRAILLVIVL